MKKFVSTIVLAAALFSSAGLCRADSIADLKEEIKKLRNDYESKIEDLQIQINALSERENQEVAKIEREGKSLPSA